MDPRWYYLGPWRTDDDGAYVPPSVTVGLVDLSGATPGERGFFATSSALGDATGYVVLGDGDGTRLDEYLPTLAQRQAWASSLGLSATPAEATLLDLLWDVLTVESDGDGIVRAKPIMPTVKGDFELWLGGHSLVRRERMPADVTTARHWPQMRRVLQANYRGIEAQSRRGRGKAATVHQRWLGAMRDKYRLTDALATALLVPDDMEKVLPLKPETTISDDFDRSDDSSGTWGTASGGWSWVAEQGGGAILSNTVRASSVEMTMRANSALSSDDHYAQLQVIDLNGCGPMVRCAASSPEGYVLGDESEGIPRVYKIDSGGSRTTLATLSDSGQTRPYTYKISVDGSTIEGFVDGVSQGTHTDTSLTGSTYAGGWARTTSRDSDDFEAGDLAAGSATIPRFLSSIDSVYGATVGQAGVL